MNQKRINLDFSLFVKEKFCFLENDFDFSLGEIETTIVRYRSPLMVVNVYHGRQSYEIGFEICKIDEEPIACFSLPVILRAVTPAYKGQIFFQASERDAIEQCVKTIAKLVEEHCAGLLRGNSNDLKAVQEMQKEMTIEVTKQYTVAPVKNKAIVAWQRRDYLTVVTLYEAVKNDLNDIEKQRLKYAKKKISK